MAFCLTSQNLVKLSSLNHSPPPSTVLCPFVLLCSPSACIPRGHTLTIPTIHFTTEQGQSRVEERLQCITPQPAPRPIFTKIEQGQRGGETTEHYLRQWRNFQEMKKNVGLKSVRDRVEWFLVDFSWGKCGMRFG